MGILDDYLLTIITFLPLFTGVVLVGLTALANAMESDNKVPLTVLYDAEGRELARLAGGAEWDSREAKALINTAIEDSFSTDDAQG